MVDELVSTITLSIISVKTKVAAYLTYLAEIKDRL